MLGDLRTDAMTRADRTGAVSRHPEGEVNRLINESISDFQSLIIQAKGASFVETLSPAIPLVAGQNLYLLPLDLDELVSVRLDYGGGSTFMLEPFMNLEEAELLSIQASASGCAPRYSLKGKSIFIAPAASTITGNMWIRYLPVATQLVGDDDTWDGFNIGVAHEYVITDVARKIATKDQMWELVNELKADVARIKLRIQGLATKRDAGRPQRVQDVRQARKFARWSRTRFGL